MSKRYIVIVIAVIVLIVAYRFPWDHNSQYEDDRMIGTVSELNENKSTIVVDISEWEKRDAKGASMTGEGYEYHVQLTDETIIKHEDNREALIGDIRNGQKVLVNPPRGDDFVGLADEVILLEMTHAEKYSRLLPHHRGLNIVVMYERAESLPSEMQTNIYANVMDIMEGTKQTITANWIPYDQEFVVDYKEELDIERLPAMLVFDRKGIRFTAYDAEELYDYFREMAK